MNKNKFVEISLIIPTLNRADDLRLTIQTIFNSGCIPKQIIVIDQSSSLHRDRTEALCLELSDTSNIEYLHQNKPSITRARNLGIQKAIYDTIVFMDDDVTINNDTFENVWEYMLREDIAMIAGTDNKEFNKPSAFSYFSMARSFKKRNTGHVTQSVLGCFPSKVVNKEVSTEWAMGFFFVVRKKYINKFNLKFDENLVGYAYAEDLDFSLRYYLEVSKLNLKCIISPSINVLHRVSTTARILPLKHQVMYYANRLYLFHKINIYFKSKFSLWWTNISMIMYRFLTFKKPLIALKALRIVRKNKKKIILGKLEELL